MPANVVEYVMKLSTKQTKSSLKGLGKKLKETQKEFGKTGKVGKGALGKIGASAKAASLRLGSLAKGLGVVGAAAIAAAGAVFSLSKKLADNVNELVDASNRTGIAAKSLAGLRLAAEGSGKSFASMERGLDQFVPKINEAAEGTGKSAEVFQKLGVQLRKTDGSLRSSNDIFNDTLKKLSQMEKGVERNAAVFDLFGRSAGGALIQSGAIDNLDQFIDRAEELGVALDENGIKKAAEFQMGWAELKTSVMGAIGDILNALFGGEGLEDGLTNLADTIKNISDRLVSFFNRVWSFWNRLSNEFDRLQKKWTKATGFLPGGQQAAWMERFSQGLTQEQIDELIKQTGVTPGEPIEQENQKTKKTPEQLLRERLIKLAKKDLAELEKALATGKGSIEKYSNELKRLSSEFEKLNLLPSIDLIEAEDALKEFIKNRKIYEKESKEQDERAKKRRGLALKVAAEFALEELDEQTKANEKKEKEREKELEDYKKWLAKSIALRKQYEAQAKEIDFSILEKLNQDFITISKKIREGDITDYTRSDLALLKTQFEDIGLDTTNIDALNSKLQELEQNAKRLENIEFGLNITTDIIGLASGDIAGSISSMLTSALERMDTGKAAIPIIGSIGGIVNSLASFGSALRDAEEKAIAEEEKKLGRLLLPDEEKAVADKARREMVEQRVQEFALAIQIAMEMLPSLLLEVLPPLLWELATRIVTGLINAILGIPRALWNMLKDWLPDWMVGDDKRSGGRYLSARSGIRFTGARDALTQLHRNEFVISESGARPQGIERILQGQTGSGIVININSEVVERSAIDELVRKIERRFQAFGSSQSSLFAG
tara:strand:- start:1581 stop:4082 length:2502 start_codon:yes stop_codon:yes gene_type:complete